MFTNCVLLLQKVLRQIEYLIEVAMRDDEKGDVKEAEKLYTCAVEVALQAVGCERSILIKQCIYIGM